MKKITKILSVGLCATMLFTAPLTAAAEMEKSGPYDYNSIGALKYTMSRNYTDFCTMNNGKQYPRYIYAGISTNLYAELECIVSANGYYVTNGVEDTRASQSSSFYSEDDLGGGCAISCAADHFFAVDFRKYKVLGTQVGQTTVFAQQQYFAPQQ